MKRILLTGANGQLGRALQKEYEGEADFILTDMIEADGLIHLDISDLKSTRAAVAEYEPQVVINCAAMTNVDGCETDTEGAYRANAIGPRNLAIASSECDAKLFHISTDYVFDGRDRQRPYIEFDTPAPISAYGRTKLAGEELVKQFSRKFFIIRTAWLYGDGHNFVKTMLKLAETHDELTVVCDQKGSPTSAAELARLIHYLEPTSGYGIYHGTCEGDTNWADFAIKIFREAGKDVTVRRVTSEEYKEFNPASADRPHYSIMDNYMLKLCTDYRMAHWEDALAAYMASQQLSSPGQN